MAVVIAGRIQARLFITTEDRVPVALLVVDLADDDLLVGIVPAAELNSATWICGRG